MQRRCFLAAAAAAAASSVCGPLAAQATDEAVNRALRPLRVLMLGGTGFLGPTIVEAFLDRGHEVTLFNRGVTNPHLFPYLEKLRGDREDPDGAGLGALAGRDFDVVIDTWQKGPKCVEDTARRLSGHARAYFYVSTIAVYKTWAEISIDESAPLTDLTGQPITRRPELNYRLRKTLGENLAFGHFDGPVTAFRSHGMRGERIASPDDEPYWPVRIWRGGDVLAPGDGATWGQFTDTISLCRFMARCAENEASGAYNVMSPPFPLKAFFESIQRLTKSQSRFIWTPRDVLARFGIEPYRDLPMWRPEPAGFYRMSAVKAEAAGLSHRSLEACAASMLEGYFSRNPNDGHLFDQPGVLTMSREAEILAALR